MRVVSLIPSATEIVQALDQRPVAVSHQCTHLPGLDGVPVVTNSVPDTDGALESTTIHANVSAAGHDVYEIDAKQLEALDPDVILTQEICEVCAVPAQSLTEVVTDLRTDPEIVRLDPRTLDEVIEDIEVVGDAINRTETAKGLAEELRKRVRTVEARVERVPDRPRVIVLDWMDPIIVTGHWVPDVVKRAGGSYGLVDSGDGSREVPWGEILEYAPDFIFVVPCGYSVAETVDHFHELTDRNEWSSLPAVETGNVYIIEGCGYINCPGPKLVSSLELLASLLHGDPPTIPSELRNVCRRASRISSTP